MTIYPKFNQLNIDTIPLGLERNTDENLYFCTPRGAKIIGWAGVDGIHFCFIRGFGDRVFAVSPMNTPGNYVHPLANSFPDFLCLLLACGHTAPLEQAYCWNLAQFETFLEDYPVTDEQLSVLRILSEKLHLKAMEHPFESIKQVQADFDYSKIKFTEDYEHFIPSEPSLHPWAVYFDGDFWGHSGRQKAGKEISTHVHFTLNHQAWYVPSVYICSKGLIVDCCVQVPIEKIRDFISKWQLSAENNDSNYIDEHQIQANAENPMALDISLEMILNGKKVSSSHGGSLLWNPCFPEHGGIESQGVLKQYELSPDFGWVICRSAFSWPTTRKPKISSLDVTIRHDPIVIFGLHFRVSISRESIAFIHPVTKLPHTLTIQEYEQQTIPADQFGDPDYDFPPHCTTMSYTVYPELPHDSFSIRDSSNGDRPRKKQIHPMEPQSTADCFVFPVIGGADDPTAIICEGRNRGALRATCSALYFNPLDTVQWQILFHEKPCADMTVKII